MKPILFNTEMVRAILDGRKTVTRRLIKPQPVGCVHHVTGYKLDYWAEEVDSFNSHMLCPMKMPCKAGDVLYVRENWCLRYDGEKYFYLADKNTEREEKQLLDYNDVRWYPSIHMPKEAARLFLKVKSVEAQRLQDILCCPGEVKKEGISWGSSDSQAGPEILFEHLWNSTVKKADRDRYGWDANPWVWAIEFEPCDIGSVEVES